MTTSDKINSTEFPRITQEWLDAADVFDGPEQVAAPLSTVDELRKELKEAEDWIKTNPGYIGEAIEKSRKVLYLRDAIAKISPPLDGRDVSIGPVVVNPHLDPIQNNCTYGYVLPDRCRYMRHKGCPCGAYPPSDF